MREFESDDNSSQQPWLPLILSPIFIIFIIIFYRLSLSLGRTAPQTVDTLYRNLTDTHAVDEQDTPIIITYSNNSTRTTIESDFSEIFRNLFIRLFSGSTLRWSNISEYQITQGARHSNSAESFPYQLTPTQSARQILALQFPVLPLFDITNFSPQIRRPLTITFPTDSSNDDLLDKYPDIKAQVPDKFLCGLSKQVISNPVYDKKRGLQPTERSWLLKHFETLRRQGKELTNPYTNQPISESDLSSYTELNTKLQKKIAQWIKDKTGETVDTNAEIDNRAIVPAQSNNSACRIRIAAYYVFLNIVVPQLYNYIRRRIEGETAPNRLTVPYQAVDADRLERDFYNFRVSMVPFLRLYLQYQEELNLFNSFLRNNIFMLRQIIYPLLITKTIYFSRLRKTTHKSVD